MRGRAIALGLGGVRGRYWSQTRVCQHLGVSWYLVRRLAAELDLTLARAPATYGYRRAARGRDWGITDDQLAAMEAELRRQLDADMIGAGRLRGRPRAPRRAA